MSLCAQARTAGRRRRRAHRPAAALQSIQQIHQRARAKSALGRRRSVFRQRHRPRGDCARLRAPQHRCRGGGRPAPRGCCGSASCCPGSRRPPCLASPAPGAAAVPRRPPRRGGRRGTEAAPGAGEAGHCRRREPGQQDAEPQQARGAGRPPPWQRCCGARRGAQPACWLSRWGNALRRRRASALAAHARRRICCIDCSAAAGLCARRRRAPAAHARVNRLSIHA